MSELKGAAAGATSPCVGICRLSDDGFCVGCLRSLDEIAAWGRLDERARRAIMADLEQRRGAVEA